MAKHWVRDRREPDKMKGWTTADYDKKNEFVSIYRDGVNQGITIWAFQKDYDVGRLWREGEEYYNGEDE